jgi:hypothetical protein
MLNILYQTANIGSDVLGHDAVNPDPIFVWELQLDNLGYLIKLICLY